MKKLFIISIICLFSLQCEKGWLREILNPTTVGCTSIYACNYNINANEDDGSCDYHACTDCLGYPHGVAVLDSCGTCDASTLNDCTQDCSDTWGGTATTDNCSNCSTSNIACELDCAGMWGGSAVDDACDSPVCSGGTTGLVANSSCTDCYGDVNGTAYTDPNYGENSCMTNECVGGNTSFIACAQDCAGMWGGSAVDDACDSPVCSGGTTGLVANSSCTDCNGDLDGEASIDGCQDCVGGDTGLTACANDCLGVIGGDAVYDNCGEACIAVDPEADCDEHCDNDSENDCVKDCEGVWGGLAVIDVCDICGGDGSTCKDCNGVPNGDAVEDNCGTCDSDSSNDCVQDCAGEWGGSAEIDICGVCSGDNSDCTDCLGVEGGNATVDECGVCNGNNACLDCAGISNGLSELDNCGNCVIDDTPGAYQFVATIAGGIVLSDGVNIADEGDMFAAFDQEGNVRGVAEQLIPPFGPYEGEIVYEMQLRSNDEGDLLNFQYYDASENLVFDITETYEFVINDILGDVVDPVLYNISSGKNNMVDWVSNGCSQDCEGVWGGSAEVDNCGVCGGDALNCEQPELFAYNSSLSQAFYYFSTITIDEENISPSDWVGAFNGDICVGARQWDTSLCGSGICDLPVMGDYGIELTAGYMNSGDFPTFKIYDASEDEYLDATPSENFSWTPNSFYNIELLNATTNP